MARKILAMGIFALLVAVSAQAASLDLGPAKATEGSVTIPVALSTDGKYIAAVSTDITYDPRLLGNPHVTIGGAASQAEKEVISNVVEPGLLRVGILGLNRNTIPDGVVADITFTISPPARGQAITLGNKPTASDPDGIAVNVSGGNQSIQVHP